MYAEIIKALQSSDSNRAENSSFYAEYILKLENLNINVHGVGQLKFPFAKDTLDKLLTMATPAKFGLREQTLLDPNIRNTKEIAAQYIDVSFNERALANMLFTLGNNMGLSENTKLVPHLHNLLIYGPGQFFKAHQDSEKVNEMIASLVIILPSPHIGGDLLIRHNTKEYNFVSENLDCNQYRCIAFYSDCLHEVEQLKQGFRIALTFNLVLEPAAIHSEKLINTELENALINYFDITKDQIANNADLVFFLDHEYSEHSLRWEMLKGVDFGNAAALRSAALKLNLIIHLTLVTHHESWTTDGDEDDPILEDYIDGGTSVTYWLDKDNKQLKYGEYPIAEEDACCSIETKEFEPYETDFEGYQGNYGNTADYWYRRAVVIIWGASSQIYRHFTLNYEDALSNLMELLKHEGNQQKVINIIQRAGGAFLKKPSWDSAKNDFKSFVQIALYINNKDMAESILKHYTLKGIGIYGLEHLAPLQMQYGGMWCVNLLSQWKIAAKSSYGENNVIYDDIAVLMRRLLSLKMAPEVLEFLLQHQLEAIIKNDSTYTGSLPATIVAGQQKRLLLAKDLLNACEFVEAYSAILDEFVKHLVSSNKLYPEVALADVLLQLQVGERIKQNPAYKSLYEHISQFVAKELTANIRDRDDWSINVNLSCKCKHCKITEDFLRSKSESKKVWPLATNYRDHITQKCHEQVLPIEIIVDKHGSPYKLIIIKSDKLYANALYHAERLTKVAAELGLLVR